MKKNGNTSFENDSDETENLSVSDDEILGKPITPNEIHEHISKLNWDKESKQHGFYSKWNDQTWTILLPSLEKIFNGILNSCKSPTDWDIGVIMPFTNKKGDRRSPTNYRGITLTSCLGKLFTSILHSKLNKYIQIHNILNPEQPGFR